ncbi:MAG: hypothetical protein U0Z17_02745 [Bacteroidales bacterium]
MNKNLDATPEHLTPGKEIEQVLRPLDFGSFAGQPGIVENLRVFVAAASQRGEALDHVLLHGPPAWVKLPFRILLPTKWVAYPRTPGPVLDKPGDLAGLLTNLETNDVLFIDEIHRLSR